MNYGFKSKKICVKTVDENGIEAWKTLEELQFKSMQGGCIDGKNLLIAFIDGRRHKKGDLTALVKINLKQAKVIKVSIVRGARELNISTMGHSNDFTLLDGYYYGTWYQEHGKDHYTNKIGNISKTLSGKGKIGSIEKGNKGISAFGIATLNKKLFLGIRQQNKKIKRCIGTYSVSKNKKIYKRNGNPFTLAKNNTYSVSQCMEIYKKQIYIVRFNKEQPQKKDKYVHNNYIETYNLSGRVVGGYVVKNPLKNVYQQMDNGKLVESTRDLKTHKWEIECLAHYKGNTFYYTMYKPSANEKLGKQAYLYKVKLK